MWAQERSGRRSDSGSHRVPVGLKVGDGPDRWGPHGGDRGEGECEMGWGAVVGPGLGCGEEERKKERLWAGLEREGKKKVFLFLEL